MDTTTPHAIATLPNDYTIGAAAAELAGLDSVAWNGADPTTATIVDVIADIAPEDGEAADVATVMDWAMGIRIQEGLPWIDCLKAAAIFYYG